MVKYKIVISNPGDFTASFFEKLKSKINPNNDYDISLDDIVILDKTLISLVTNAKESLDIMAPFQTNIDGKILSCINTAIEDGIDVRILSRYCFEEDRCFDKGKIANYVKHFDHREDSKKTGSLHAKMVIRDRNELYFGSGELMETSLHNNLEIGILTNDQKIVNLLCIIFDTTWELAN